MLNEEDIFFRKFIKESAVTYTEEEMEKIKLDAPWIRLDGNELTISPGMISLLRMNDD